MEEQGFGESCTEMSSYEDLIFCIQKSSYNGEFLLTKLNTNGMESRRLLSHHTSPFTSYKIYNYNNIDMEPQIYPLQVAARFNNVEDIMYVYCVIATSQAEIMTVIIKFEDPAIVTEIFTTTA